MINDLKLSNMGICMGGPDVVERMRFVLPVIMTATPLGFLLETVKFQKVMTF